MTFVFIDNFFAPDFKALIALVSLANVHESIGWVSKFNLASVITTSFVSIFKRVYF